MKKFINDPTNLTAELLEGLEMCFSNKIKIVSEKIVCRTKPKSTDKVAILTLGGAGHEPALSGFVGEGMLDASVVGDIFAAPGAPKVLEALRMFKREAGIILVTLNHAGDRMSASKALRDAAKEGIKVVEIVTCEDISAGIDTEPDKKRGLGGCVPLYKVIGAAAEQGKSIDEIVEIGERFHSQMATLAVAITGCTHPQNGEPIAVLPDDEMEIGMGQHGEAGGGRSKILTADETAERMVTELIKATGVKSGDSVLLLINGSGATTLMEMLIVYRKAGKVLQEQGISLTNGWCGEILTVQEMGGFQMILCKLDQDHKALLSAKTATPYWSN
ncbi:MAG: dihydroxyacetone kinase subunit DhaK [Kiritimatiellia bacterium]